MPKVAEPSPKTVSDNEHVALEGERLARLSGKLSEAIQKRAEIDEGLVSHEERELLKAENELRKLVARQDEQNRKVVYLQGLSDRHEFASQAEIDATARPARRQLPKETKALRALTAEVDQERERVRVLHAKVKVLPRPEVRMALEGVSLKTVDSEKAELDRRIEVLHSAIAEQQKRFDAAKRQAASEVRRSYDADYKKHAAKVLKAFDAFRAALGESNAFCTNAKAAGSTPFDTLAPAGLLWVEKRGAWDSYRNRLAQIAKG